MVPPPEAPAGSSARWAEQFSIAVDQHGWRYALREIGWRRGLALLRVLLAASFGAVFRDGRPSESVKSSEEVTREVVAELDTSAADEHEAASRTGASGTAVVPEPDYERFLELLQRRESEEREATGARLLAARGRETTLYAAHLTAAVLTVVLAFLAVGLALAADAPDANASAPSTATTAASSVTVLRLLICRAPLPVDNCCEWPYPGQEQNETNRRATLADPRTHAPGAARPAGLRGGCARQDRARSTCPRWHR